MFSERFKGKMDIISEQMEKLIREKYIISKKKSNIAYKVFITVPNLLLVLPKCL